jgi:hypothetical protein
MALSKKALGITISAAAGLLLIIIIFWLSLPNYKPGISWDKHPAVVFESDDWGYCAWIPDRAALTGPQAVVKRFAGWETYSKETLDAYSGSTLESAADIGRIARMLTKHRGGDGRPPLIQANYIMAAPDYRTMKDSGFSPFAAGFFPDYGGRWARPGLMAAVEDARRDGVWAPEYHGYLHFNMEVWLRLLAKGEIETKTMFDNEITINKTMDDEYEYDVTADFSKVLSRMEAGVDKFEEVFGYAPKSTIAPDYYWPKKLEPEWARAGIEVVQGWRTQKESGEEPGKFTKAWRLMTRPMGHIKTKDGRTLVYLNRNAHFEPRGIPDEGTEFGMQEIMDDIRKAWRRNQPAIVSTHRLNFVHLDGEIVTENYKQFEQLISNIIMAEPGVVFLTDYEVANLFKQGYSVHQIRPDEIRLRNYKEETVEISFTIPKGRSVDGILNTTTGQPVKLDAKETAALAKSSIKLNFKPGDYSIKLK